MAEDVVRVRYHFVGQVQNRGFRFACYTCARRAKVTGWVRNERNGTVTAEAQGRPAAQRAWLAGLAGLVDGFGTGWSVGRSTPMDVEPGEADFRVRRY